MSVAPFPNNPGMGFAFVGPTIGGQGDNLSYGGATTTGQLLTFYAGTQATPDTVLNPLAKFSRTLSLLAANVTGDGAEQASAGGGIATGTTGDQVQTVGWYGIASNAGTAKGATLSPDACGLYGVGRILAGGIGVGIGAYFRGLSNSATGLLSALQVESYNNRGANDVASTTGFPNSSGIWLWANGPNMSAQAITIGNPFGRQFDAGLVLSGQVNGAQQGGVASTGILIAGVMSKAAISVVQGAGPVVLGAAQTGFATAQLDVVNTGTANPIAVFRSAAAAADVGLQVQNATGSSTYFAAGGANHVLTGTVTGDTGVKVNTANFFHIGGTVSTIKVGQANTLGFFNAAAVAQPSAAGTAAGYAAGATVAVFHSDDTYTGNVGATGYTINGIVAALKNLGLLAA